MKDITKIQMKDIRKNQWKAYERVKNSGAHNMFTPQAIEMSGLNKNTYWAIIENYSELKEKYEENK